MLGASSAQCCYQPFGVWALLAPNNCDARGQPRSKQGSLTQTYLVAEPHLQTGCALRAMLGASSAQCCYQPFGVWAHLAPNNCDALGQPRSKHGSVRQTFTKPNLPTGRVLPALLRTPKPALLRSSRGRRVQLESLVARRPCCPSGLGGSARTQQRGPDGSSALGRIQNARPTTVCATIQCPNLRHAQPLRWLGSSR
jgi:hypothetical protein